MRTSLRFTCICLLLLSSWTFLHAQRPQCGFDERLHALENADAAKARERAEFEARLQDWIARHPEARTTEATYIIPTVVHCIQASSTPVVTDACVQSQIDVLNEDFQALNADSSVIPAEFQAIFGNCSIEFCLATIDPSGNPTNGIVRIVDPTHATGHTQANEAAMKGLSDWDPTKYFNIWVPQTLGGGLLGYATFPSSLGSAPQLDGIVLSGEYFGRGGCGLSPFDLGRTATHEAGHWLGLYHTFESGCAGNDAATCASAGDRVCDTPPTSSANFGCPGVQNTCTETPVDHNDQTHNYMDYGDDRCIVMFTDGQAAVMQAVLNTTRASLVSQANHTATGCGCSSATPCAPVANIGSDARTVCPGQTVHFTDMSSGPAASWTWTFSGGTPFASTSQNPSVTYNTPGVYDVTLEVTNALGTSTQTFTGYITVTQAAGPPLSEGFETTLPSDWLITNQDNSTTWVISDTAAFTGSQSLFMDNWAYDALGTKDALLTRIIDMTTYATGEVTFAHAYKTAAFINDSLYVYFSMDCGETWEKVWAKGGTGLASVTGVGIGSGFIPATANDWDKDTIQLAGFLGTTGFKVKFETVGRGGQNLFLDDINISGLVGRTDAVARPQWLMETAPNPFQHGFEVRFNVPVKAELEFRLIDLQGRTVYVSPSLIATPGKGSFAIPEATTAKLAPGVYLLRGQSALGTVTQRVVKLQ